MSAEAEERFVRNFVKGFLWAKEKNGMSKEEAKTNLRNFADLILLLLDKDGANAT